MAVNTISIHIILLTGGLCLPRSVCITFVCMQRVICVWYIYEGMKESALQLQFLVDLARSGMPPLTCISRQEFVGNDASA